MVDFHALLKKYWGYDSFRPLQLEVIRSVCNGRDTLVLMPTGGGKSLTYQIPALAREGICVVITPLIALMKDQTDTLKRRGILSISIHSGMSPRQIDAALDNCIYGDYKFLYISPERIDSDLFRTRFAKMNVSLIAVDEAHCISQWGYDFRPSYLKIARLRELSPDSPILALTASATPAVVNDIIDKLKFGEEHVMRMSFSRPNLSYVVRNTENKPDQLLRIIRNVSGSGIVYVRTRERTEKIAEFLNANGITADFYHGGLGYLMRSVKQDKWIKGKTQVIVATNAFGMGIDKPDVRFVVHFDLCDSLETYYQEAGRAGRDGLPAYAVILLSEQDKTSARKRINLDFPPIDTIKKIYEALYNYYQIEIGGGKGQAREFNIFDFCSKSRYFQPTVVNAAKTLQLNGYLTLTDETDHPARILFIVNRDDLYRIQVEREELDYFIKVLLRSYTGLFSEFVPINMNEIAYVSGYTLERVHELLKRLWQLHIIKYIPGNRSAMVIFTEERLPIADVRISPESYKIRKQVAHDRLADMVGYAENTTECRSLVMQRHFGEETDTPCGKCDICRERKRTEPEMSEHTDTRFTEPLQSSHSGANHTPQQSTIRQSLLERLSQGESSLHELVAATRGDLHIILDEIRILTEEGTIIQRPDGIIRLKK